LFTRVAVLVVLQFPVSDARAFRSDREVRLDVPNWNKPRTDLRPEFVHFFGRAVERRRGADNAWTDEMFFCLAKRALRFNDLATRGIGPDTLGFRPASAFRRLFSDGSAVVRVEVGVRHNEARRPLGKLDEASLLQAAADVCALPTWVPQPNGTARQWKPLLRQDKALAELYGRASSRQDAAAIPPWPHARDLVCPGRPLVLVELSHSESQAIPDPFLPDSFTTIDPTRIRTARASFGRLRTKAGVVDMWVIRRGDAQKIDLRSLRLCLLRLHAEQEALDLILRHVEAKRLPDAARGDLIDDLDDYFNRATKFIKRDNWVGVSKSAILEAYDAAEEVTPSAERSTLEGRFAGARVQIARKIEDYRARRAAVRVVRVTYVENGATYMERNVTTNVSGTGNVVNVAEFMSNVTNTVTNNLQQSSAGPEIQALVTALTKQIEGLGTKIDPVKTQQMGSDVEALSKELASPQPRQKWYEVSLSGLKEAAEAVGEVGKPILETIAKLWPLLLP